MDILDIGGENIPVRLAGHIFLYHEVEEIRHGFIFRHEIDIYISGLEVRDIDGEILFFRETVFPARLEQCKHQCGRQYAYDTPVSEFILHSI